MVYGNFKGTKLMKNLRRRRKCRKGAEGCLLFYGKRRICGCGRGFRFREKYALKLHWRIGFSDRRQYLAERRKFSPDEGTAANGLSQKKYRLCVSVLSINSRTECRTEYHFSAASGRKETGKRGGG